MAKALGTTPEEEHKPGLYTVGRVSTLRLIVLEFQGLISFSYVS